MGKLLFDWKPKDVEYIIENWGKESAHSMKKRFNCSWQTVANKAKELGLSEPVDPTWTAEEVDTLIGLAKKGVHYKKIAEVMEKYWQENEIEYLEENYNEQTYIEIAKKLNRTAKSVAAKAESLGLSKQKK